MIGIITKDTKPDDIVRELREKAQAEKESK